MSQQSQFFTHIANGGASSPEPGRGGGGGCISTWLIFLGIVGAIVVAIALQRPPTQADRAAEGACFEIDAADAASSYASATPAERDVAYQLRVGSAAGAAWLHAEMEDQAAITGTRVGPVFRSVSGSCGQDYPELMTAYRSFRGWEQSG